MQNHPHANTVTLVRSFSNVRWRRPRSSWTISVFILLTLSTSAAAASRRVISSYRRSVRARDCSINCSTSGETCIALWVAPDPGLPYLRSNLDRTMAMQTNQSMSDDHIDPRSCDEDDDDGGDTESDQAGRADPAMRKSPPKSKTAKSWECSIGSWGPSSVPDRRFLIGPLCQGSNRLITEMRKFYVWRHVGISKIPEWAGKLQGGSACMARCCKILSTSCNPDSMQISTQS